MKKSWKDNIYFQREELARQLHEPMTGLAGECTCAWGNREPLNEVLMNGLASIPHSKSLYCLDTNGCQISDSVGQAGVAPNHYGRDRSRRPYFKEAMPPWGFLLSDAYISLSAHRPSLTAMHVVSTDAGPSGYLVADFDLRDLPVTAGLYDEPGYWRQIKGDPAIRRTVFQQRRVESALDRNFEQAISILDELLAERGVFQCQIHFSSSQAVIWTVDDPFCYRMLDHEALSDPDICLVYPPRPYPLDAAIPQPDIHRILRLMRSLRLTDPNIYLRTASINLLNGMVSLTFSCDGTHYMSYVEFLLKDTSFWF